MPKRVLLVLSLLLLIGLGAPVADARPDPDPAPFPKTAATVDAPKIQPAIFKPRLVKPKMPAPKLAASFGFHGGAGLPKLTPVALTPVTLTPVRRTAPGILVPQRVQPREVSPESTGTLARSARAEAGKFQGFGGAFAKPAVRLQLTRPAPALNTSQSLSRGRLRSRVGTCTDGSRASGVSHDGNVTWFEKSEERVVSSRYVPLGATSAPRRPVDGYNPTNPDNAPYTKHYNVCCTPNCNTCDSCSSCDSCSTGNTCSSCDSCDSCRPCVTRRPRVRRIYYRPACRPVVYARPAYGWGWGWRRPYWGGGWGGYGWGGYGWGGYGWGRGWGGGWGGCW